MKSVAKKVSIVIAIILCVLLLATLILGLIRIRPLNKIGDYNNVRVLKSYSEYQRDDSETLDKAIDSVKFSVLRSMYEFNADFDIKAVTKTETNDDGEDEKVNAFITSEDLSLLSATNGSFMLMFSYDQVTTNKLFKTVDGELIRYDSLIIIIPKSDKKLTTVTLYPYLDRNIGNSSTNPDFDQNWVMGSQYYNVYEFTAKMHTYDMYEILLDNKFEPGKYQSNVDTE